MDSLELYNEIKKASKGLRFKGTIDVGGIVIDLDKADVVGNIMQEWVEGWLKKNGIMYALNDNTQMPPDFFLDPDDKKQHLLEIKAFNYKAGPGFDIADFRMYEQEIMEKPWMLHVSYLIFGYDMSDEGVVTIKKMWLQKVWEITRPMKSGKKKTVWPINLQIKKDVVHKIRPAKWYAPQKQFKTFENLEDFLSAVEETVYQNTDTRNDGPSWKQNMINNYRDFYNKTLNIPRWNEIVDKYVLK